MKIDLNAIIEAYKLDRLGLSQQLFPSHRHPAKALRRVCEGLGLLDTDQLLRLAAAIDLPADQIGRLWTGVWKAEQFDKDMCVFKREPLRGPCYEVRLDLKTGVTQLLVDGAVETVRLFPGYASTTVEAFAKEMDALVAELNNKKSEKNGIGGKN